MTELKILNYISNFIVTTVTAIFITSVGFYLSFSEGKLSYEELYRSQNKYYEYNWIASFYWRHLEVKVNKNETGLLVDTKNSATGQLANLEKTVRQLDTIVSATDLTNLDNQRAFDSAKKEQLEYGDYSGHDLQKIVTSAHINLANYQKNLESYIGGYTDIRQMPIERISNTLNYISYDLFYYLRILEAHNSFNDGHFLKILTYMDVPKTFVSIAELNLEPGNSLSRSEPVILFANSVRELPENIQKMTFPELLNEVNEISKQLKKDQDKLEGNDKISVLSQLHVLSIKDAAFYLLLVHCIILALLCSLYVFLLNRTLINLSPQDFEVQRFLCFPFDSGHNVLRKIVTLFWLTSVISSVTVFFSQYNPYFLNDQTLKLLKVNLEEYNLSTEEYITVGVTLVIIYVVSEILRRVLIHKYKS